MESLQELRSPREAALKGDPLRDRTEEVLFELARRRSIPGSRGFRYLPGDRDLQSPLFDGCSVPALLNSLARRSLALPLPELMFEADGLQIESTVFVRSGPIEILEFMYADAVKRSARAALCWLGTMAEDLPERLERSLARDASEVEYAAESAFFRPNALLNLVQFEVAPPPGILRSFSSDLKKRLLEERAAIRVDRDLLFPLIPDQIEGCYEVAGQFLVKDAERIAAAQPVFKSRLKRLDRVESRYYQDPRNATTARFLKKKARLVMAATRSGETPPLSARVVRALAPAAEQAYRASTEQKDREYVERFHGDLINHGGDWRRMTRIMSTADRERLRPAVWTTLVRHPELFGVRYERPTDSVHLFVARDRNLLPPLISGMLTLPARETWRTTALKELIESNRGFWSPVLSRDDCRILYNKLLRKAYLNFLPWYVRPLLFFNFEGINLHLFNHARQALNAEQKRLASEHNGHSEGFARRRETDPGLDERIAAVSKALEELYFKRKTVPAVRDVARQVGETDIGQFRNLLEASGFRILYMDDFEESALFFANGQKYDSRVRRMKSLWPQIKRASIAADPPAAARRAQRLQTYLGLPPTPAGSRSSGSLPG